MKLLSSLTNRIFLASALLAVLAIGFAIYVVNARVTREAEAELRRGLVEAGTLVDQHRTTLVETFTLLAHLIADLPKFKAAVETKDAPTVRPLAEEYQEQVKSDLFVVTNHTGGILAAIGASEAMAAAIGALPAIRQGLAGSEATAFLPHPAGVLQVVTVPIAIGLDRPEMLGTLSLGFLLDDELAAQFKNVTESEIAFAVDGQIRATTLNAGHYEELAWLLGTEGIVPILVGGNEYVALLRPLWSPAWSDGPGGQQLPEVHPDRSRAPMAIILRSRTERLRFLSAIHTTLGVTAVLAVLLATISSYGVARTVTRPLATITAVMREMAATGDLTQKIALRRAGNWDDEDARLLATTFNTLTDSIARFQREAAQRERLSSLGQLSTVVAHEIRNPLMIIKASLRTLQRDDASRQAIHEAAADIDEEVARLNRIVNEVLDFARPIRFDYMPADLNAVCADAAAATMADRQDPAIHLDLDPALPPIVTDAERLRTVLVNILTNARQAVLGHEATAFGPASPSGDSDTDRPAAEVTATPVSSPAIELSTQLAGRDRVAIVVRDAGGGIDPSDLSRVFEPYFTTRRGGTGLGLAIAKNIVDGFGGVIRVQNRRPHGTEIWIELPVQPVAARGSTPGGTVNGER